MYNRRSYVRFETIYYTRIRVPKIYTHTYYYILTTIIIMIIISFFDLSSHTKTYKRYYIMRLENGFRVGRYYIKKEPDNLTYLSIILP